MKTILDSRERKVGVWIVSLTLIFCMRAALAVDLNTGPFQLDGNAEQAVDGTYAGDDWDTLPGGATAFTGIRVDRDGSGMDSIYTGGGSKTPNLISSWQWKTSPEPPSKDDITHAYAANYMVEDLSTGVDEQVIYFGADLYAVNGDAELAFWFFQGEVKAIPEGATQGTFSGAHVNGDPYVAVKFSNGGSQANITVYEWFDGCGKNDIVKGNTPPGAGECAAENIRVVIPETDSTCDGSGGKAACAISNQVTTAAPWSYLNKEGGDSFLPTAFYEGGINIYDALGGNKCFSAFAVVTGASTSFTATAKDFVLADFDVCSVDVSKVCANDNEADDTPDAITYNLRGCGINDGGGTINITSLTDLLSLTGASAVEPADLAWFVPGTVDGGRAFTTADCDDDELLLEAAVGGSSVTVETHDLAAGDALVYTFSTTTVANGVSDTVTIDAQGTDGSDIDADSAGATCPLRDFPAGLNVTKQCAADLEVVGSAVQVKINVKGTVCNTGEVELKNLVLADDTDMPASGTVTLTPLSTTLAPKDAASGVCTTYTGSYTPTAIPGGNACPFADVVVVTATTPINSKGDGCKLNPDGETLTCTAKSNTATCNLRALDTDTDCSTGPLSLLPPPPPPE